MAVNDRKHLPKIEPPKSISDQIYDLLRKQILSGELGSGERLLGKDMAQRLNASRTPVREAFRCLEHDGLVERLPQGGVRVKTIAISEINEFFDIRVVLEAYAVELACDRITPKELSELAEIESKAQTLLAAASMDREEKIIRLLELNTRFHEIIYRAAGNTHLSKIINDLKAIAMRMRTLGLREDNSWVQVWQEHSRLLTCIGQKDKAAAAALIRKHLANAASYVISTTKKLGASA